MALALPVMAIKLAVSPLLVSLAGPFIAYPQSYEVAFEQRGGGNLPAQ